MHHVIQKLSNRERFPELYKEDKRIDRRTCKREVPMKVLVLGMMRTGTACQSLFSSVQPSLLLVSTNLNGHLPHAYKICHESAMKVALEQLGYNDTYHAVCNGEPNGLRHMDRSV
jgi:hypothetical protein